MRGTSMSNHASRRLRQLLATPVARALLALRLMVGIGAVFNADGAFFRWSVHRDMLRQVAVYGMLACGMPAVIISAGIDLSVSSLLALSAVTFTTLTLPMGWGATTAVLAVLAAGVVLGSFSGFLVARMRLQPFIVTLAMRV
ncbi:MAG: ABC transporter permease, partial [Gemmatimonadetes bacterium]|nr:ABC transporter permease [Gemmatimonadota bacterium]